MQAQAGNTDSFGKVTWLFDTLHKGGSQGVTVLDMAGKMPRTASEALAKGGDCTDLANIVISLFKELKVPGGAMVLHFNSAPENVDHMVPYAMIGGRKYIVDLQAGSLGQTAAGEYTILHTLSYDQAAFMFHREAGDYFKDKGTPREAVASYRRANEFYTNDGYTFHNLGVMLERSGDMAGSAQALKRAGDLDPRYRDASARGSYNQELEAGGAAYERRDWKACAAHFRTAKTMGERLTPSDIQTLDSNIAACEQNARNAGSGK
jgi:hypothetical protein